MDKFKGKEALLLEKMTQRYDQGSDTLSISLQKRNEVALDSRESRESQEEGTFWHWTLSHAPFMSMH
jgi:hypothetical protein